VQSPRACNAALGFAGEGVRHAAGFNVPDMPLLFSKRGHLRLVRVLRRKMANGGGGSPRQPGPASLSLGLVTERE
jgi:hypothetical protein